MTRGFGWPYLGAFFLATLSCAIEDEALGRKTDQVPAFDAALPCLTANPEGCTRSGCAPGHMCYATPLARDGGGCVPTSCSCDTRTGTWSCTADCSGGVCQAIFDGGSIPRGDAARD